MSRLPRLAARLVAAGTLAASTAQAQTLMGRVVDAGTGEPVPKAVVGVRVGADSIVRAHTGDDGVFALQLPSGGTFVVHIQPTVAPPVASDSITVPTDSVVQREFRVAMPADPVFHHTQVDSQVAPIPGSSGPRYPAHLKTADVEGEVFASFVVDTTGRAVPSSFRALRETHADFTKAVVAALEQMRFVPAERSGRKVSTLVEQPFGFCVGNRRTIPTCR